MTTPQTLAADIKANFGDNLNAKQLWTLVKLSKHVRLRCRNNAAFNNCFNAMFPYAKFQQVTKQHPDGTSYPGLSITAPNSPLTSETITDNDDN